MNWTKVIAATGVLVSSAIAHADIKYTQQTTMAGGQAGGSTAVRAVKPGFERMESSMQLGSFTMENITIRDCAKKRTIQLDKSLKIYSILPDGASASSAGGSTARPAAGAATTGKVIVTYNVKAMGTEKVAGFKARHYMLTTSMQMSGCTGNGKTNTKMEIWVANIQNANACTDAGSAGEMARVMSSQKCKIAVVTKGDIKGYTAAVRGLIVRQKIYNGNAVMMTTEVTSLSAGKAERRSLHDSQRLQAGFARRVSKAAQRRLGESHVRRQRGTQRIRLGLNRSTHVTTEDIV